MTVRAAGGLLWRDDGAGLRVAVVHRPRYGDWSLPKGKAEAGEHPLETAVREVGEETGQQAVAGRALGTSRYDVLAGGVRTAKTVRWWALRRTGGEFVPGPEVDELRWLAVDVARALLTAGRDGAVLEAFCAAPAAPDPLLLVRHASAGQRGTGPDDEARPLDDLGRAQASRLADLLPLLGVRRLVAAPPLRCGQSLEPLAARLGVPVVTEPVLADARVAARPAEALALLRALGPGTAVCAQGDGLPRLRAALGGEPDGRWPKGAARALTLLGDGRLAGDDLLLPDEPTAPEGDAG